LNPTSRVVFSHLLLLATYTVATHGVSRWYTAQYEPCGKTRKSNVVFGPVSHSEPLQAAAKAYFVVSTATKEGMVIVEIGQTQKKYFLHRAILPHHSEYLQKALSGPWKDVTLNDVETSTCKYRN
jgi:hypothetical protein